MSGNILKTVALLISLLLPHYAWANGHVTETVYSANAFVRLLIAGIGGVLSILGVFLAFKNAVAVSNVSLSRTGAQFKGVSQGVVIAILGVIVLIAGLYLLPDKTIVTDITGKEIIRDQGRTRTGG
jgi:hypothetical protein